MEQLREMAQKLWEPGNTLSQQAVRGGFWVFALRIADRLLKLIRTVVLARILAPADFGLMGVALLAMSTLRNFVQTGFQTALVQKQGDIEGYLDTAWTVSILRGLALFAILYLAAPHVALFFDTPEVTSIIRVLGLAMVFYGSTNVGVVYFQKEFEFNRQFIYRFSDTVANLIVAVAAALVLRSVWALVLGSLAGGLVGSIVSYASQPYRPRVRLEWAKVKELFNFGRWVVGTNVLAFLTLQGDDIFLGKLLGAAALGFYQLAFRFSNISATEIADVVGQVTFPTYSKLQDDVSRLRRGFLQTVEAVASLSLPLSAGIFILAPDFVRLFLGEKWTPIVAALRILTLSGLLRSIQATGGPLFHAVGRPNLAFWMNLVKVIVMAIALYPLTRIFGLSGTATAVGVGTLITLPMWWCVSTQIVEGSYVDLLKSVFPSLTGTVIMSAGILVIEQWMGSVGLVEFATLVLIGSALYAGFLFSLWRWFRCGPVGSLRVVRRFL